MRSASRPALAGLVLLALGPLAAVAQAAVAGPDGPVTVLTALPDGRVLVGGRFAHYNGLERSGLARLLPDGRLDPGFVPAPSAPQRYVTALVVQPDGRLLVGGARQVASCPTCQEARGFVERLLPDGTLDPSFAWPAARQPAYVRDLGLQADGCLLVCGDNFPAPDSAAGRTLVRLLPNGRPDSTFALTQAQGRQALCLARQVDGQLLVGYDWPGKLATDPPLQRLTRTGLLDTTLACPPLPPQGSPGYDLTLPTYNAPEELALQPDGRILAGGNEAVHTGSRPSLGLVRLLPNGRLDPSFQAARQGNRTFVQALLVQPDGRILLGSDFFIANQFLSTEYQRYRRLSPRRRLQPPLRSSRSNLAEAWEGENLWVTQHGWLQRLLPDGQPDPSFHASRRPDGGVWALVQLPGGQLLAGGNFTTYDGRPARYLVRLNADGTYARARQPARR